MEPAKHGAICRIYQSRKGLQNHFKALWEGASTRGGRGEPPQGRRVTTIFPRAAKTQGVTIEPRPTSEEAQTSLSSAAAGSMRSVRGGLIEVNCAAVGLTLNGQFVLRKPPPMSPSKNHFCEDGANIPPQPGSLSAFWPSCSDHNEKGETRCLCLTSEWDTAAKPHFSSSSFHPNQGATDGVH